MFTARSLLVSAAIAATLAACNRNPPPPAQPTPEPAAHPTPPPPTPPTPPTAAGPSQELRADEYVLTANLTAPSGGAPGSFRIEIHGAGEYHVNEQYPIAVETTVENGAMPKTSLRRGDAAEFTQTVARFEQPVTAPGGNVRVHGTVRFGVCRAEQCAFFNREFAVATP